MDIDPAATRGDARPKAKFVTAVWGEAYIRRFATLSLPSFLAPGNLPALALATHLEVVVLTRHEDVAQFESHLACRRLRTICPVRFVAIDDLITTGVYGFTLTLAYARAVIECGEEMLSTHFVFMNADFVLADGSLRALSEHILAGHSIVLGPSFRATAEAVEARLEAAVDRESSVLSIPPRQLAVLALPHPHPTTVAKIVNQGLCHSTHPNQFFWQVDETTLLGRYYLIFMLCLKPERIVDSINCFCDYAFIPEMCPSGDEVAMGDSDDFFMLELQKRDQEMHMLTLGRQADRDIARSLREWTTAEHRRAASHDIVFHTRGTPTEIEAAKAAASAFVDRINGMLGRPVPHASHPYWIRAVQAWRRFRRAQGLSGSPPELAEPAASASMAARYLRNPVGALISSFWAFAYAALEVGFGRWPSVTVLHPSWADSRHLREALGTARAAAGARLLVVRREGKHVDPVIGDGASVTFASLQAVMDDGLTASRQGSEGFTAALIYVQERDIRHTQRLMERCREVMQAGGTCELFIHVTHGEGEEGIVSGDLVAHVDSILPAPWWSADCSFVGGTFKRLNGSLMRRAYRSYARIGIRALLWVLPALSVVIPLTLIGNLYLRARGPSRRFVPYCSSVLIRFAPLRVPAAAQAPDQRNLSTLDSFRR